MTRRESVLRLFEEQQEFVNARIKNGIDLYRKGDAELVFKSANGVLPENISIEVEQTGHAFKFGANLFMLDEFSCAEKNALYREKFANLFNLATLPFYWRDLEPEMDKPRYAADSPKIYRRPAPDLCIAYCEEKGIEPKLHCLNYDAWMPDWIKGKPSDYVKRKLVKRFREIGERYADKIPMIEVINETFCPTYTTDFFMEDDVVEWSFREAVKYFPANKLVINEAAIVPWGHFYASTSRNPYYMQIQHLLQNNIPVHSIGIQYHSFDCRREDEANYYTNRYGRYNPQHLCAVMDRFEKLNLPMQITEMTIPSYSWEAEDEAVQAEILRYTYSLFFAQRSMEAIVYWNLPDGYAAWAPQGDMTSGENYFHGGLLRFDLSEKPGYTMLHNLIHKEWHTSDTVYARNGKAFFRGFHGSYKLTVHAGEQTIPIDFSIRQGTENKLEITL